MTDRLAQVREGLARLGQMPAPRRLRAMAKLFRRRGLRASLPSFRITRLTKLILLINAVGLMLLSGGTLYMTEIWAGLVKAKVDSLSAQGQMVANAVASQAGFPTDQKLLGIDDVLAQQSGEPFGMAEMEFHALGFPINPVKAGELIMKLVEPDKTRARLFDRDGVLLFDSQNPESANGILRADLPPVGEEPSEAGIGLLQGLRSWLHYGDLPIHIEDAGNPNQRYDEIDIALNGTTPIPLLKKTSRGELIVSVAVPVQRTRIVLGAVLLTTPGGAVDDVVAAEQERLLGLAVFAFLVMLLLTVLLAHSVASPIDQLAAATRRVRHSRNARRAMPRTLTRRNDEIGNLSRTVEEMTTALYDRIDAFGQFASDVSHELKNPLAALRSAAETMDFARTDAQRDELNQIIRINARRIERLLNDIADQTRLDAEFARRAAEPVDLLALIRQVERNFHHVNNGASPEIRVLAERLPAGSPGFVVMGHETRLLQVLTNVVDNALSFSPPGGLITVTVKSAPNGLWSVIIEDEGPGIPPEHIHRIFDRFFTFRPQQTDIRSRNSGLGLSLCAGIIATHGGRIWAENRGPYRGGLPDQYYPGQAYPPAYPNGQRPQTGARFTIELPSVQAAEWRRSGGYRAAAE